MRRMTSLGASGSTYEPEVLIIPGIGKNSHGYDLPYNESQSGKKMFLKRFPLFFKIYEGENTQNNKFYIIFI